MSKAAKPTKPKKQRNMYYVSEIILNSEMQLYWNSKRLEKDPSLYNDEYLEEIETLREKYKVLDYSDEPGIQKEKKEIRDKIRTMSSKTYVKRDPNIFGELILLIINRSLTSSNFNGYSYVNEMVSLAVQHILLYSDKFDPFKQSDITGQYVSSFAYISTITFNAAIATINAHKKQEKKAKEDFLETQKLFHRDPNESTIYKLYENEGFAEKIYVEHIPDTLYDVITRINPKDNTLILYNKDYSISMSEFEKISKYTKERGITLSYIKNNENSENKDN